MERTQFPDSVCKKHMTFAPDRLSLSVLDQDLDSVSLHKQYTEAD